MIIRLPTLSLLFCITIPLLIGAAVADELNLKNGDRLTGAIVKMDGHMITIKTSYGGEFVVKRQEVIGLKVSGPMAFELADGTVVEGAAFLAEKGKVNIKSAKTGQVTFHDLAYIKKITLPGVDENRYMKGRLNAAASVSDGNTDTKSYHFETEVIGRADKNRLTVGGSYNGASDLGSKTEENMEGHLKYDYFLSKKWYLYANAAAAKDRFKDLNLRTFVGFGAGRQIWESEKRNLSLEAGLGYTDEDYDLAADDHYPSGRWAANYDQQLFDNGARFFHKHELLIGLEDVEDLYLTAKTGVGMPLYRNLSSSVQVDFEWDNTPAEDTERSDTLYRLGIDYNW